MIERFARILAAVDGWGFDEINDRAVKEYKAMAENIILGLGSDGLEIKAWEQEDG